MAKGKASGKNVVRLVDRMLRQMDAAKDLIQLDIAFGNLETALQAAKIKGLEEIANAVIAKDLVSSREGRDMIMTLPIDDPMGVVDRMKQSVKTYENELADL
ncbi:hypothetical protein [Lewinella sp. W8]|uniref:hypothetical protein n=1 Tax=Lewinella sp. W8 TaxID=2528208 RepID=UPI001067F717|nr:hypothetical protein [Lewinella sp. W8]MTB53075.1 hypothetical protein [Lewinella sp. W8]